MKRIISYLEIYLGVSIAIRGFVSTCAVPLLDQLFPEESINSAFEKHPLLSTVYEAEECSEDEIPNISLYSNNYTIVDGKQYKKQDLRLYQVSSLFQFNDLDFIFRQGGTEHKMTKKISIGGGMESIEEIPRTRLDSVEKILTQFEAGFSLLVNKIQRHWMPIVTYARRIEDETNLPRVGANLYVTPPNDAAFDSHWDPMDVIVVQVYGQKYWNVAKDPTVYLSNQQQKRKPTLNEIDVPHYPTFLMKPGDVLYIPRGFLHNASTVGLFDRSLHVTFGVHPELAAVKDLIEYAIDPQFHSTVQQIAHQNSTHNVLRQSLHSWRSTQEIPELFEEALKKVETVAETLNDNELVEACKAARGNFDSAISILKEKANEKTDDSRKKDDTWLDAFKDLTHR
mmetsp:Transcript_19308/g.29094  ORF Transcript_19308/g.29094 Transcript_19308/m.29094 type:complete len:397 (+) Transcript_19308:101-1291(+)